MKRWVALLIPAAALFVSCASPGTVAFSEGVSFYQQGRFSFARDAFNTSLRHDPRSAAAWNNLAASRARLGDHDGAIIDYTRALHLAPHDAEIVFNRGNAYAAAGNLSAAIADFTTATVLRADYARAYFTRGAVRSVAGDRAGAIADWQSAIILERDPETKAAMARVLDAPR
jgi:tetratricopeptide (TPR) repeat protein